MVELYLTSEVSYQELALSQGINNPSLLVKWVNAVSYTHLKQEAVILSLDALGADGMSGESFIADTQINVEEETVHNIMLEKRCV